jgi:hypothetical protein
VENSEAFIATVERVPECSSGCFHPALLQALEGAGPCNFRVFGPSTTAVNDCRCDMTKILKPRWYGCSTSSFLLCLGGGGGGEECIRCCGTGMHLFTPTNTYATVLTSLSRTASHKFHLSPCHNLERVTDYWVSWLGFEAGASRIPVRRFRTWATFSFFVIVRVTIRQDIE